VSRAGSPSLARRRSLGYQVNHLARLMALALRDRIAPHGVAPGQFAQLLALYEEDGITQAELCDRVRIEQPTMANTLQRMERDGLVSRAPDPNDGRSALITLTDRAKRLEQPLTTAAREVNRLTTQGLSRDEVTSTMRALATMIANLEAEEATPR
jgi:DNA-binding MarR family transcriptional regulator